MDKTKDLRMAMINTSKKYEAKTYGTSDRSGYNVTNHNINDILGSFDKKEAMIKKGSKLKKGVGVTKALNDPQIRTTQNEIYGFSKQGLGISGMIGKLRRDNFKFFDSRARREQDSDRD